MSNAEKAGNLRKEFDVLFPGGFSSRQFWWLVKFAKTVRKFARSNTAFNNLCNMAFVGIAVFEEVEKLDPVKKISYKGLRITVKKEGGNDVYSGQEREDGAEE